MLHLLDCQNDTSREDSVTETPEQATILMLELISGPAPNERGRGSRSGSFLHTRRGVDDHPAAFLFLPICLGVALVLLFLPTSPR